MDRAGVVSDPWSPGDGLKPVAEQGQRPAPRRGGVLGRIFAPLLVLGGVLLKVAGSLKFLGVFLAVGGYALIWGWRFGLGFVLLILVHELGHYVEAKRQGLNPQLPVFIPFFGAYVALRNQPFDPWQNALVSAAGPVGRRDRCAGLSRLRQRDRLRPAARARLRRLLPQPDQPGTDRVPRRWPHPPRVARAARRRRPVEPRRGPPARRRRRCLLDRAGRGARDRHGRIPRPAESPVNGELDRRVLSRGHGTPETDVALIAAEFLCRVREDRADRPARRLDLRLGPGRRGCGLIPVRARDGRAVREGGVRGRHGRRPGGDGSGEPRLPGGGWALGRLQHQPPARAGRQSVLRHLDDVQALLRPQDDVREGGRGVRHLSRWLRHARRAVRVV